jgi:hypothetical protein
MGDGVKGYGQSKDLRNLQEECGMATWKYWHNPPFQLPTHKYLINHKNLLVKRPKSTHIGTKHSPENSGNKWSWFPCSARELLTDFHSAPNMKQDSCALPKHKPHHIIKTLWNIARAGTLPEVLLPAHSRVPTCGKAVGVLWCYWGG